MPNVAVIQDFFLQTCCSCGVAFAIPTEMDTRLRKTHAAFYCPNGHQQWYCAQTEEERLKKALAAEETRRVVAQQALAEQTERLKRIEARVSAGVCPHCNRSFQNLKRHMHTKHENCIAVMPEVKRLTA
jgi:hypothetical protein